MISHRRATPMLGLMATLAAAMIGCVPQPAAGPTTPGATSTPASDGSTVVPTGTGQPTSGSTPNAGGTSQPGPGAQPTPEGTTNPTATPTPSSGGGGSSGGSSSGPSAAFDVQGDLLRVQVSHKKVSDFINTFVIKLDAVQLNAATDDDGDTTFVPKGGTVDLGDLYHFDLSAADAPSEAGSLELGLPLQPFGAPDLDSSLGIWAEGKLTVPVGDTTGNFARARVFSGAADLADWKSAPSLYLAERYNAQSDLEEEAARTELAKGQVSKLDFRLPVTFNSHAFSVKVYAAHDGATASPLIAGWNDSLIAPIP